MCIICIKEAGRDMPTNEVITRMWRGNPDGAGFMFPAADGVHIRKGFMTMEQFNNAINELSEQVDIRSTPIIMHFRIGTHGGKNCAQNTHPFPVSTEDKKLRATRTVTPVGFAHNGTISVVSRDKELSDTMMYAKEILSHMNRSNSSFYTDTDMLNIIENTIDGSRMVFMDKDGVITRVGKWVTDDDTGLIYSNNHYLPFIDDLSTYSSYYGSQTSLFSSIYKQYPCRITQRDRFYQTHKTYDKKDIYGEIYLRLGDDSYLTTNNYKIYDTVEFEDDFYVDSKGDVYVFRKGMFYPCKNFAYASLISNDVVLVARESPKTTSIFKEVHSKNK